MKKRKIQDIIEYLSRYELISLIYATSYAYLNESSLRDGYNNVGVDIELLHNQVDDVMRDEIEEIEAPFELCEILNLASKELQENLKNDD